ncbi:Sec-independent protein translocase protein TatB [Colwellia sp. 4_MG-2023]|jgi:sec-independent protein translocase protein TatB|uniref:Sec-independent protein translocase protein TatB n=1 Tax=unclassified Colwellia TaxID=196834 RepID=UPI001C08A5CA|nr:MULTISPECIES: Sec-independent protein translocase protein TatB [unclassified Colwellia]MBU2925602.1 Sec-independent protein translocase protein TatB [Colwellia sp. C2M11]MDO6487767.1 Sec-independent protein translocase protein TatB [Colwellia sp. 6_MG-2023]MDO6506894.1 Sec-independent protein translocase protein TatB [Colwellia sp. 5_MG-2023]MDO6555731.1 Sec-independent protein translocase protein TatB [Colwellia sp. 4_MG-2023]MDO6652772.1 Sec-independent protein translocase protein TatB [C
MFDIGFWELMLIGIIGLIVLGPERLPVAIRTVKGWIAGVRNFSDSVKSELTEELRIHELHANLKKAEQGGMKNLSPEIAESVKSLQEAAEMVREPFKNMDTKSIDEKNIASSPLNPTSTQSTLAEDNEGNLSINNELSPHKENNTSPIDTDKKE